MNYQMMAAQIADSRVFVAAISLVFFWAIALIYPYREIPFFSNSTRFIKNLVIGIMNSAILIFLIPLTLMEVAKSSRLDGSFSFWPGSVAYSFSFIIFGILILDLVIYWQHRMTHKIPILWRLHRLHHSDIEIDTTTSSRFHFIEILFSLGVKAVTIYSLGIHPLSVIVFEILLNTSSNFNHSNFNFPNWIEKPLRWILITPELHRIHHSTVGSEMNSNFGFSLSLWDRLFFSYRDKSEKNPKTMIIGLDHFRSEENQSFLGLLIQPLKD